MQSCRKSHHIVSKFFSDSSISYYILVGVVSFVIESSGNPFILNHVTIYSHKSSHSCCIGYLLHRIIFVCSYVCWIEFSMNSQWTHEFWGKWNISLTWNCICEHFYEHWLLPRTWLNLVGMQDKFCRPLRTFAIWKMWSTLWIRGAFVL